MQALANEIIRVRINEQLKKDATLVLDSMGLTMSDAIRIFLMRLVDEKALPFELKMPKTKSLKPASKILRKDVSVRQKKLFLALNTETSNELSGCCL